MENVETVKNWFLKHDDAEFEKLYNIYKPVVYRFILSLAPDLEDFIVADIVQDVFVEIYSGSRKLRDWKKFKAWLFSVSKFVLYRYFRKEKQQKNRIEKQKQLLLNTPDLHSPVEKQSEQEDLKKMILAFQSSLVKPIHREMFALRFFESEKYETIAKICGCSVRKVKYEMKNIFNSLERFLKSKGLV